MNENILRIVAVFHGPKHEGIIGKVLALVAANPPMTVDGMVKVAKLIDAIKAQGPYGQAFSSRMARALDAMSLLANALDIDFETINDLGQHGSGDVVDGKVVAEAFLPGYEGEGCLAWHESAKRVLAKFHTEVKSGQTILVVSHRPIIGALVDMASGASFNAERLLEVVLSSKLTAKGFVVFDFNKDTGVLTIVE
ncbi:MAG: histidine phosphatase family protein [Candidatus Pacebacteria bacterium]|nr:histidine phosphatase family protein [Candidatus Paceibacterota bacterium]